MTQTGDNWEVKTLAEELLPIRLTCGRVCRAFFFLLMEVDTGKVLRDCIIYLANMLGSNLVSRAPPLCLLQILPKDFCLEFLPKFSQ